MSPEEVVDRFVAAIERGDVGAALEYMTPECEYDNVPVGKSIGLDAIRQVLTTFVTPESPPEFKILRQVAQGNLVFNERVDRLHGGGREVIIPVVGVWEVDAATNKVKLWRDYFDISKLGAESD